MQKCNLKYGWILAAFLFWGCNKDKGDGINLSTPVDDGCHSSISISPYLVGKWKLIEYVAVHYNLVDCSAVGSNTYNTQNFPTNALLEISSDGTFKTYKDDSLLHQSIATSVSKVSYGESYFLNCQQLTYSLLCVNGSDTISNTQLGDTLKVYDPFLNLNFHNDPVWSIIDHVKYVKIE